MMKHRILTYISLLIILSCDHFFHEDLDQYITIDTEQEKLEILNGIYAQLVKVYNDGYFEAVCRGDDINIYPAYSFPHPDHPDTYCSSRTTHDYTPNYENIYHPLIKIILNSNNLIAQLNNAEDATILGELYFLRAYSYFVLSRFFGNPHIVTDIDVDYTRERPAYVKLYQFIESDIHSAMDLLPVAKKDARVPEETPCKATAMSLLAELYLSWAGYPVNDESKYNQAMTSAGELITNRQIYGIGLELKYSSLWEPAEKYSSESIFALYFSLDHKDTRNRIGGYRSRGSITHGNIIAAGSLLPEFKYFNDFPDNARKKASFIDYRFKNLDPFTDPCEYMEGMFNLKWLDSTQMFDFEHTIFDYGTDRTLHLLRFAQTLLTYSESRARMGILDDSTFEAINMVRRRANGVDPLGPSDYDLTRNLTQEQFIDSVVWERAWELNFEPNGRWFDIVRLDLKDELSRYRYDHDIPYEVPEEFLQEKWYFYEIPR